MHCPWIGNLFIYTHFKMNPFMLAKKTIFSICVNFTNIRSLSTTVAGATNKKISHLLELRCEVNIVIDTRANLDDVNKLFDNNKLK